MGISIAIDGSWKVVTNTILPLFKADTEYSKGSIDGCVVYIFSGDLQLGVGKLSFY